MGGCGVVLDGDGVIKLKGKGGGCFEGFDFGEVDVDLDLYEDEGLD